MCMQCAPPSVDERIEIWTLAHKWFKQSGNDLGQTWLAYLLTHERSKDRRLVMEAAFAGRAIELVEHLGETRSMHNAASIELTLR